MEICLLSTVIQLAFITTALLSADFISFDQQVVGYLSDDVKLGCKLLQGNLTQIQWVLCKPEQVKLLVYNPTDGIHVVETPLKGRLELSVSAMDASLTIKDVKMNDTGTYTCQLTSFPSGTFEGNIVLTVQDHPHPMSSGVVIGIVTAVLLLMVTLTVVVYLVIFRKRHEALFNSRVDARGLVVNADRTRTKREVDLVYSDITSFRKAENTATNPPRDHQKHVEVQPAVDVTYAAVAVGNQNHVREEIVYNKMEKKDPEIDNDWII